MKIFTSYYSKVDSIDQEQYTLIRISSSKPEWLVGRRIIDMPVLYPHWDIINAWKNHEISWEEYTKRYYAQLNNVPKHDILSKLEDLSGGKDVVLLCWEGAGKPCHRQLIGPWLGLDVKELVV